MPTLPPLALPRIILSQGSPPSVRTVGHGLAIAAALAFFALIVVL